jgi:hypothetical protein
VTTERSLEYIVERNLITKRIYCGCTFHTLNHMFCSHVFCLLNALQIKSFPKGPGFDQIV